MKRLWSSLGAFVWPHLSRLIPRSLMGRYTLALIAIGLLVIFEQVVTQVALRRQVEDQKLARLVEVQLYDIQRLAKAALAVQLATRDPELGEQSKALAELAAEFKARDHAIEQGIRSYAKLGNAFDRLGLAEFDFTPYTTPRRRPVFTTKERFTIRHLARTIEEKNGDYRLSLRALLNELDDRSTARIATTTRVELALFALVLLVLFLEGMYIFRPSLRALEDALKMRSSFMSRMSHEIRNPMNAIIGMTDVLFETPLNELQQRYLQVLSRSSQTLLELLNSLLDFSSLEDGKALIETISFDLHEVLAKVIDLSAVRAHEKNLELSLDLDFKTPLALQGDPLRLQQVLSNLLSNAIKFTSNGEVRLHVEPGYTIEGAPTVRFIVSDTGIGIKPESLSKIFDSFVQADTSTRRQFGGSGLGLTIARDLVRLMGGDLSVESEVGHGSKFTFSLPLVTNDPNDTLSWRLREYPLTGRTAFLLGPMTGSMRQAADLIVACGGQVETRLESVDLYSSESLILISPLADDSLLQFLPGRVGPSTRVVCLIQTILPPGRMKSYLRFGVTDFVMAPLKPLEFLPFIAKASTPKDNGAVAEDVQPPTPVAVNRKKVLIVDDAPENRDLMQLYLSKQDLDLVFAVDGLQALQKFKTEHFDLVLTDIQMPVMDGIEELVAIREWEKANHVRETPIVAITADSRPEARVNLAHLGFKGILIKPLRKADLLAWIGREFDGPEAGDAAPPVSETNA